MKRISFDCLVLVILIALVGVTTAGTQEPEPTVLVRRVVPANFYDPDFDQVKLRQLLAKSINRSVVAQPNSTVSGLIKDLFNVSQSWTPKVYNQVEAYVLDLNNMRDPARDLKAGQTVIMPDLPRTAQVPARPMGMFLLQAKSSLATNWDPQIQAFVGPPTVGTNAPGTAATELQIRMLPVSALDSLQLPSAATPLTLLVERHEYQVMQEPMELTFAGEPQDTTVPLLGQVASVSLKGFLSRLARTRPILVILDDGFPSQSDFFHAAEFVIKASREIRQKFGLQDATHGDSPALLALEQTYHAGTQFCDEDCEYPKLKMHSAMIRESLKEMMELDTSQRVEIIYLPINEARVFWNYLLGEMLSVALLADSVTEGLVLMAPGIQPPAGSYRGKPDYSSIAPQVDTILKRESLSVPLSAYSGGEMHAQTDKGIIDGIVNFLYLYSWASQRPHFLSMSWTAPNLKYPVLFRPNGYGILLAAAGNNPTVNIHTAQLQFAARSSDPGDVLAVGNLPSACGSSPLGIPGGITVFGFAFPGRISSSLCGTSFSTPRVAWFLAAYEAIKGEAVKPYTDSWTLWRAGKRDKLTKLQNRQQAGEARYSVTPWQLLGEPEP